MAAGGGIKGAGKPGIKTAGNGSPGGSSGVSSFAAQQDRKPQGIGPAAAESGAGESGLFEGAVLSADRKQYEADNGQCYGVGCPKNGQAVPSEQKNPF